MKHGALVAALGSAWAIQPEKLEAVFDFLKKRADGTLFVDQAVLAEMEKRNLEAAKRTADANSSGSVAVLPVYGAITHRSTMMSEFSGGTSTQMLSRQLNDAANNSNVKAIVLDVDSPGGTVDGVAELADEIYDARSKKPVTALANGLMASAAYWLGASATDIAVTPSGQVGSIGVFGTHTDLSGALANEGVKPTLISAGKYKTEGNPYEPLGDDARAAMQAMVDDYYGLFVNAVAKGRGVSATAVRNGFGEGRMVSASAAVRSGMADRVATLDQVLAGYGVSRNGSRNAMAVAGATSQLDAIRKRRLQLAAL